MHADADAEERPAFSAHRFLERRDHAADGVKTAPAVGEGADAGQHHPIGRGHDAWIVRHHDRLLQAGILRRAFERLGRRVQVAGAVIDDGDGHRPAPGSGKRPMTWGGCCTRGSGAGGGGGEFRSVAEGTVGAARTQSAKKRRSASSRS